MLEPVLSSPPRTVRKKLGGRCLCARLKERRLAGLDNALRKARPSLLPLQTRPRLPRSLTGPPRPPLCSLVSRKDFQTLENHPRSVWPGAGLSVSLAWPGGEEPRSWLGLGPGWAPRPRPGSANSLSPVSRHSLSLTLDLNPGSILSSESPRGPTPLRSAAAGGP